MARVNINILGISKLNWTGMGQFSSNDHYIYYCGQESLRRNRVTIIVNKTVRNAVLGCNLKNDRMISVHFQGKTFNITVIEDGGGVGRGEHFLPHKFIKRAFKRRVNFTKQLLNAGRGHQAPRKAAQLFKRR